jgi:A/G-specific adenine glycosylase
MNKQKSHLIEYDFFINYFQENGRYFSWRKEDITPFESLLTEMLLRQTRAESVEKIWLTFLAKYPDTGSIISAENNTIKNLVKDLGLVNQRVQAMNLVANWLEKNHRGKVPREMDELLQIPHVGKYTAKAVRCFSYSIREEIVDVNILRFISRFFGKPINNKDVRRNKWAWEYAKSILPMNDFKKHNYGLLDFSSTICKARRPHCKNCQIFKRCNYFLNN